MSFPRFTHYSGERLDQVKPIERLSEIDHKPRGFWLSVDEGGDGWADWCRGEEFMLDNLKFKHEVRLAEGAKIRWIKTVEELLLFSEIHTSNRYGSASVVNWPVLMKQYQGILISPYQLKARLDRRCFWYYTWDCASACIWDAAAIKSIQLVEEPLAA